MIRFFLNYIKYITDFIHLHIEPCYLYDFCPEWDEKVNYLLDGAESGRLTYSLGVNVLKIQGMQIWIENFPYAYGKFYGSFPAAKNRPSKKTIMRLRMFCNKNKYNLL